MAPRDCAMHMAPSEPLAPVRRLEAARYETMFEKRLDRSSSNRFLAWPKFGGSRLGGVRKPSPWPARGRLGGADGVDLGRAGSRPEDDPLAR